MSRLSLLSMCTAALTACGGGGGETPAQVAVGTSTTYTAAALPGELVTYIVDPVALTYSYTITESQYGLTGKTGSGSLTSLGSNGYSLSNIPGSRIQLLPNGLMLGSIQQNFGSGVKTVPVIGLSNPVNTLVGVAGTYNFLSYNCGTSCSANYGTLTVQSTGTWDYCVGDNLSSATHACTFSGSGNLTAAGGGKFDVFDGVTKVGTLLAMSSGGQNVGIVDFKDTRTGGANVFGRGIAVASSQTNVNTTLTDGNWYSYGNNGFYGEFTTTNTAVTYTSVSSGSIPAQFNVSKDTPWSGLIAPKSNSLALMAGFGVYVYADLNNNYFELGLKKVAATVPTISLAVISTSFQNDGLIAVKYAGTSQVGGLNISPAVSIANLPSGTAKVAIVMDDETFPCGTGANACIHWGVFNLPATKIAISEGENLGAISGVTLGGNYAGTSGYEGPNPPNAHVYNLTVYALDSSVILSATSYTRSEFESAFSQHILDKATISGRYPN